MLIARPRLSLSLLSWLIIMITLDVFISTLQPSTSLLRAHHFLTPRGVHVSTQSPEERSKAAGKGAAQHHGAGDNLNQHFWRLRGWIFNVSEVSFMNGDIDIEYMKCIKKQLQPIFAPVWIVGHWPKFMVDKWRTQQFMSTWTKSIASSTPFNSVAITLSIYEHNNIEVLNHDRNWGIGSYCIDWVSIVATMIQDIGGQFRACPDPRQATLSNWKLAAWLWNGFIRCT